MSYETQFDNSRNTVFRNRVRMAIVDQCERDARASFAGATPTALELATRTTAQNVLRTINREEIVERAALFAAHDLDEATVNVSADDNALRRSIKKYFQAINSELDNTTPT